MIEVRPPGDKSVSHRAALLGGLGSDASRFTGLSESVDVRRSIDAMRALGARADLDGARLSIDAQAGLASSPETIDCGNSGTTVRLLAGLLAGLGLAARLDGDASLRTRPMRRIVYPLQAMGGKISYEGAPERLPIAFAARATGSLRTLRHRPRVASAQVKSAVLLAGVTGRVRVTVAEPALSRDHTERLLLAMGVPLSLESGNGAEHVVTFDPEGWDGVFRPVDSAIPGDPSSAAFLIGAGLLTRTPVHVRGVSGNPTRTGFLEVLESMGAQIDRVAVSDAFEPLEDWTITPPDRLAPFDVGGDVIPGIIDELPLLGALAARADGRSRIRDAAELRVKESDRIVALADNLTGIGIAVSERPDGLDIEGSDARLDGSIRTRGDHRTAMAFGVLSRRDASLAIDDPGCVDISFPGFWQAVAPFGSAPAEGARAYSDTGAGDPHDGVPDRVVAIDGPAASGKSTTAKAVAARLGWVHVNSGLFYRALTWWTLERGIDIENERFLADVASVELGLVEGDDGLTVQVDGSRPGRGLHSVDVADHVSAVAAIPAVRDVVLERLRGAALRYPLVCDGRDIGTTVFPEAALKIYLVARATERARRRLVEREGGDPPPDAIEAEAERLRARDEADSTRAASPLKQARDAVEIDTTGRTPSEVVEAIVELAGDRGLEGS